MDPVKRSIVIIDMRTSNTLKEDSRTWNWPRRRPQKLEVARADRNTQNMNWEEEN